MTIIHTKAGFVMLTEPWPEKPANVMNKALKALQEYEWHRHDKAVEACLLSAIPFQDQARIRQIVWDYVVKNGMEGHPQDNFPYQIEYEVEIQEERLNSEPEVWGKVAVLVQTESAKKTKMAEQLYANIQKDVDRIEGERGQSESQTKDELKWTIIHALEDLKKLDPHSSAIEGCLREMQFYNPV